MFEAMHLIPMQLAMAAAEMRAREHLQMLKLPVIMQLQDQPLPQPPHTIQNDACVLSRPSPWVMPCSCALPACTPCGT